MSLATPLMSERARAWLASVKDVPPDQLSQRATQAAQTGMISFGDAIALKQMADRISGAAKKDAPSPTSVVQDLKQQIQNPQPPQQVNMPSQDPRMQAGIATLPAPAMENVGEEASMAGGGIVAFAGGGGITQEQIAAAMASPVYQQLLPKVIQQESGGNPNAVSPKGARGIMQVMPRTLVSPGFGVQPAKNNTPAEQARVGREYLAAMLIKHNWNVPAALQAYNAGPGMQEKIASGKAKVPAETQKYVKSITGATSPPASSAALPTTGQWAGVGTAGLGGVPAGQQRFLADVLTPGAAPATPEEAARFDKAYGPNWRTRYQGMTHTKGVDVSGPRAVIPKTQTPAGTKPAETVQATEVTRLPDNAPLLSPIDVDAEMRKQGMSKQDRLLMLANAGFKMAQAASQPGAKFLGSAAVGGSEAAQGLAALKADERAQRRALQEAAYKREESLAALGLKGRELDISERLGLGKLTSEYLKNSAALSALNLKIQEFLKNDEAAREAKKVMDEEEETARKNPNGAAATRFNIAKQKYDMRYQQIAGNILLNQQTAAVSGEYPGYGTE